MDSLYLLQFSCFIITTLLFLFIAVSRLFVKWVNKKYERSRWLLAAAMLIFSVHYLLQMIFGFRASGDDVGALINILFYSPALFLISYSIINIECSKRNRRLYILTGVFGYLSILSVFAVGWLTYGSLHIQIALQVMRALFFISVLFLIFAPIHEIRKVYVQIEKATGSDMKPYRMYLSTGYVLLLLQQLCSQ